MQGDFDLYKSMVRFGCNKACLEKCKNNSLFRYNNGNDANNEWLAGIDIQFQCKTGYKKITYNLVDFLI